MKPRPHASFFQGIVCHCLNECESRNKTNCQCTHKIFGMIEALPVNNRVERLHGRPLRLLSKHEHQVGALSTQLKSSSTIAIANFKTYSCLQKSQVEQSNTSSPARTRRAESLKCLRWPIGHAPAFAVFCLHEEMRDVLSKMRMQASADERQFFHSTTNSVNAAHCCVHECLQGQTTTDGVLLLKVANYTGSGFSHHFGRQASHPCAM